MTDREAAKRYHWFCTIGYRKPVLNDPKVILDQATPDHIDQLIQEGIKRWPFKAYQPEPDFPRVA